MIIYPLTARVYDQLINGWFIDLVGSGVWIITAYDNVQNNLIIKNSSILWKWVPTSGFILSCMILQ